MKNGFLLYYSQYSTINLLSIEEKGELLDAIYQYNNGGISFGMSEKVKLVFSMIESQFKIDKIKYDKICERNKKNGMKGGRPTNKTKQKPSGLFGNPKKPKKPDNDNDNDKDNVNNKEYIIELLSKDNNSTAEYTIIINYIIDYFRKACYANGLIYDSTRERQFAKHLISKKFKEEIVKPMKCSHIEAIERLIRMGTTEQYKKSTEKNFWHGKICGPKDLYDKRSKIINNYLSITKR